MAGANLHVSQASYVDNGRRHLLFLYTPVFVLDQLAVVEYGQQQGEGRARLRVKLRAASLFYHRISGMVLQWYKENGVPEEFIDEVRYTAANWVPFALLALCLLLQSLLAMLHTEQV
jgi:hypothetical protein